MIGFSKDSMAIYEEAKITAVASAHRYIGLNYEFARPQLHFRAENLVSKYYSIGPSMRRMQSLFWHLRAVKTQQNSVADDSRLPSAL